ncbi:MAG: hypothetical protein K2H53_06305 [Clostridia bacterium]|nr:hypothetical protein [Clostridia bacterium]
MNRKEIEEKLRKERNLSFVGEINYCGKKYIKALKDEKNGISYMYYEIDENEIKDIRDHEVESELKKLYSIKLDDKIY